MNPVNPSDVVINNVAGAGIAGVIWPGSFFSLAWLEDRHGRYKRTSRQGRYNRKGMLFRFVGRDRTGIGEHGRVYDDRAGPLSKRRGNLPDEVFDEPQSVTYIHFG